MPRITSVPARIVRPVRSNTIRLAVPLAALLTTGLMIGPPAIVGTPSNPRPGLLHNAGASTRQAPVWGDAEEQAFVGRINGLRASLGLPTLAIDPELAGQARIWAQTMKDAGNIFHTDHLDSGISADWQKLGENVGVGGTVDSLFDAFVASPKHYENLVDPAYRFVGIGVVWDGDRMFTTHRFMSLMPAPAPAPPAAPSTPARPATAVAAAPAPTTAAPPPEELAATEPPTTPADTTASQPPVAPPASPTQVALVLETVDALLG